MKFNTNKLTRAFNKVGFSIKKHSPEILMATGVVGVVAGTVMACKATTKLSDILDESKDQVEKVHMVAEDKKYADQYSAEDAQKDLTIIYTQTAVKVAKLYAPAVLVGVASIGCMLYSHRILSKRNVALAAAYATVDKTFKKYRDDVVERFGEKVDKELRYGIKAKEVDTTVVDENGEEQTVTETVEVSDIPSNQYSDYAKFFDCGNPYWEKDAEYNLMFLKRQEQYANDKLKANGYLFLNDVYESIGIPKTKAGQVVGWVYDENNPIGDNYVDFGIYDLHKEAARDFVNGYEKTILLDFNVDGNIWDLM